VPYQAFKCSDDKYVNVAVGSERLWQRFCLGMGLAELAEDPDYVDNSHRVVNRQKLVSLLQKHFDEQPVVYWVERLLEAGVPCGAINDIADVLSDEQVVARDMLLQIPHPTLGTLQQTGIPVKFSETPGAIKQHPPLLGEHTQQILLELGYSESQVADLEQAGAI
jgi:crotonobetainyl-CoA:carnitine CoA-transferase CaiB-like acyl-CoA transferase